MRALLVLALVLASGSASARSRRPTAATPTLAATETFGPFAYQFSQTERIEIAYGKTIVSVVGRGHTPWMGWFPMRVSIDNTGGPRQTVKLVYRTAGSGASEVARSIDVEAGQRVTTTLTAPAEARYGTFEASSPVIGRQAQQVSFASVYNENRLVLNLGTADEFEAFIGQKPDNANGEDQVVPLPLEEAPTELAAYLGTNAVTISDARGYEGLSEAQRRALEGWVAVGGTLVLRDWPRTQGALPLLDSRDDELIRDYGLGHVAVLASSTSGLFPVPKATLPVAPLGQSDARKYTPTGTASYSALLPQAMVPIVRFLLIITVFTLLIGPGSVWLARKRGPAVLLASIPLTAFATCVLILTSSLIIDGFTVHASTYSYTLLDRGRNRAVTVGLTAWYANLAPRSAVFDATTGLVAPRRSGGGTPVDVDWSEGAKFASGFVPSRTYREWGVVSVQPSRARLVVKQKGEGFVLQNGLGHRVATVWVRVGEQLFLASDVRDGAEVPLQPDTLVDEVTLAIDGQERFEQALRRPVVMRPLEDGQFLAKVEGVGFVPTGGVRLDLHRGEHVVRGEFER